MDADGRITFAGTAAERPDDAATALDLRPWVLLPGMVDLHAHLPQLPNAGLGAGLDLLTWLDRYVFPLERGFDEAAAERLAPVAWRSFAAAGTTTAMVYGAVYAASLDASFRAAEAHGIRAIVGKVMMDRGTYDETIRQADILDRSLQESADLISRWHGRDAGGCATRSRRGSRCRVLPSYCASPRHWPHPPGAYWQTHVSEDRGEIAEVARLFPEALDYVDVYDRAGGLGARTVLAHAVHLSDRELARLVETGRTWRIARLRTCSWPRGHAPRAIPGGRPVRRAWARTWPAARTCRSSPRCGPASTPSMPCRWAVSMTGRAAVRERARAELPGASTPTPLDWIRMGSLDGARALGLDAEIGSLEAGKEADLIVVDPSFVAAVPGASDDDPEDLASRLIFRSHPDMVRGAWVRGRRLEGPGARG